MDYKRKPKVLFLDLETDSLDVNKAKIKFVGMMDESGKETMMEWNQDNRKAFLDKINQYDKIVTFNGEAYDLPILKNHGIEIPHWRAIDLYVIYKKKAPIIQQGGFKSYSLKNLVKEIGVETDGKGTIDYHIFMKDEWTVEEYTEIYKYLKQDLVVTKQLWDFLIKRFDNLKEFIGDKEKFNFKHVTSSTGAYAYSAICHELGIEAEYGTEEGNIPYEGGFVLQPLHDSVKGHILYLDFASLYPQMYCHANLFSSNCKCCTEEEKWHGNDMFKVEGKYCTKQQGRIEEVIKRFYLNRKAYKKVKDPREFALKIILNCFSEDTEILTEKGVKLLKDCIIGEKVYSINPITEKVELKEIEAFVTNQYSGDMIHFNDKNKDLIVTPNHDMLFQSKLKKGGFNNMIKIHAEDVIKKSGVFPKCSPIDGNKSDIVDMKQFMKDKYIWKIKLDDPYSQRKNTNLEYDQNTRLHVSLIGYDSSLKGQWFIQGQKGSEMIPEHIDIKDLFYFIGIVLSEGHKREVPEKFYENGNHRGLGYSITIAQSEDKHKDIFNKILNCLNRIGVKYSIGKDKIVISSKFWYDFFNFKTNSFDCNIPSWIFNYDSKILQYIHEGLYDGDGNKGNQYRYSTVSKQLRDDVIKLNLHLGYRCYYSKEDYVTKIRKKARTIWRVHRTTRGWYGKGGYKIIKNPTDKVICCSVKDNHTLMAGRNGNFVWTGQTLYGISAKPSFKQLYNPHTASDCTSLARQCIQYAMKTLNESGFEVVAGDTDSCFVDLKGKPREECLDVAANISKTLSDAFPFPWDEFNFKLEDDLVYLQYFRDKTDGLKKKNYIYITKSGKMTIKGLDIIKKNCSDLGIKIFKEYLERQILERKDCLFEKKYIDELIESALFKNKNIIAKTFNIKENEEYASKTSIYNLIKEKYGTGEIKLIKNHKIGAGKGVKYCSLEEANELEIADLDLDDVYKELSPFITDFHKIMAEQKLAKKLAKKAPKVDKNQKTLNF